MVSTVLVVIILCSVIGFSTPILLLMTLFRRSALPPPNGRSRNMVESRSSGATAQTYTPPSPPAVMDLETKEIGMIHLGDLDKSSDEDEDEDDDGAEGWESFIDKVILFPGADEGVYRWLDGEVYFVGYL
jgi:hypothetical protein